ncbi:MAG: malectin domain-containing carbohydrate-binding protein, partial [Bacteroidota bacterium]
KAEMMRRRFDDSGLYGRKVAVIKEDKNTSPFLPYIYDLIVLNGDGYSADQITKTFNSLRPYGGTACFTGADSGFPDKINKLSLENGEPAMEDNYALLTRKGSLPGSGQWTHQYGSSSNRTYSDDELVKPPLGTLWFGGPSNMNALPRHHNGPVPQVVGGKLFILGMETISARCVYTGRELWVKEIPGIGHAFTSLEHEELFRKGNEVYMPNHPGANFIGSPYVSLEDAVYIIDGDRLLTLDPATGDILTEFRLPQIENIEVNEFGHIMVAEDYLITTIGPQFFDDGQPGKENNWNATSSSVLLVMNRHSGEVLWKKRAEKGFRHNAIVAGGERLFLVDGLSKGLIETLQRRGEISDSELLALDLKTGKELWSINEGVFGTWLGFYEDKNILLQGGRQGQRGAPEDEPDERLIAHSGSTGEIIWKSNQEYTGPLGLHPDMIIPGGPGETAYNPSTGEALLRDHPITNNEYKWDWHKYYGCGTMNTSKHLITFRSSSAGYNDLLNFGGTANISGWKAGCTNNLVVADGVLNGPDYTRTCTCSYPLQCSFGLVHMPDAAVEMWTLNRLEITNEAIRRLGINFGAQGNRREDGVLWLEYPKAYPKGPDIPVKIESNSLELYENHASWIENPDKKYDWVASYGAKGITSISVDLVPDRSFEEQSYTVALYFAEPEDISAGKRIFDVSIQGEKVLENFDVVDRAGGSRRTLRKEFKDVKVKDTLSIEFSNNTNATVISGVEIVMDDSIISSAND